MRTSASRSSERSAESDLAQAGGDHREPVAAATRQHLVDALRLVINIVWFLLHGWLLALAYLLAGVVACLLIVTIPFGIASFRLATFAAWPFGRTTVRAPGAGVPSVLGNVLWFLFAGWWLALLHVTAGIAYCLTIIGIPFGIALFKLALVGLFPWGSRWSGPTNRRPGEGSVRRSDRRFRDSDGEVRPTVGL